MKGLSEYMRNSKLNDMMRDRFVTGLSSQRLRERLLLEGPDISFALASKIALQYEQVAMDALELTAPVQAIQGAMPAQSQRF